MATSCKLSKQRTLPDIEKEKQGTKINDSVTRDKVYIHNEGIDYDEEMLACFPAQSILLECTKEFEEDVLAMTKY